VKKGNLINANKLLNHQQVFYKFNLLIINSKRKHYV